MYEVEAGGCGPIGEPLVFAIASGAYYTGLSAGLVGALRPI
jgi:hypothetical protein